MSFSCEKISGVKILQATKTQSNELPLSINSKLKAGNMEVIIIVDNQHYESIAANEVKTIDLKDVAGKSVVVIMAAESANVDVSVTRK